MSQHANESGSIASAIFPPKPLSYYRDLTKGGRVTIDLSQDEACVALKVYDRGVEALDADERFELDQLMSKLKEQLWP